MRLAIGIICSSGFKPETDFIFGRPDSTGEGLLALQSRIVTGQANARLPKHLQITDCSITVSRKFPTDVARNELCMAALNRDFDYLLFLDADMAHPAELVERLLLHERPVISARYHLKKPPFATIAYVKHRTQLGPHRYATIHFGQGVFEIERGGAGALLIRADVLTAIHERQRGRWERLFDSIGYKALPSWVRDGHLPGRGCTQWFRYQYDLPDEVDGKRVDMNVSEDFWFYQQARESGFSCWIDWDLVVPHIGPMAIDDSWNKPFLTTQMSEYEDPAKRDFVRDNTIVMGYPGGMVLGEGDDALAIPEYEITPGER